MSELNSNSPPQVEPIAAPAASRPPLAVSELYPAGADSGPIDDTLRALTDARLVTTFGDPASGERFVDSVHGGLPRSWPRLRDWLAEDRAAILLRESIRDAAREWQEHGLKESYLAHQGQRLEEAQDLPRQPWLQLNALESDYLDASLAAQKRGQHRNRLRAISSVGVLVLAAVALIWFVWQQRQIDELQRQLDAVHQLADAAIDHQAAGNDELGAVVAREAYLYDVEHEEITEVAAIDAALRAAVGVPYFSRNMPDQPDAVSSLALSSGIPSTLAIGATLAPEASGGLNILDWRNPAATPFPVPEFATGATALAFSPDGRLLAAGQEDGTALVWERPNPEVIRVDMSAAESEITALSFAFDGRFLAAATADGAVSYRDWRNPDSPRATVPDIKVPAIALAFLPDGRTLAIGLRDGTAGQWSWPNPALARNPGPVPNFAGSVTALAFSPLGDKLAVGGSDGTVRIWDWLSPTAIPVVVPTRSGPISALGFTPDGRVLAVGFAAQASPAESANLEAADMIQLWSDQVWTKPFGELAALVCTIVPDPEGLQLADNEGQAIAAGASKVTPCTDPPVIDSEYGRGLILKGMGDAAGASQAVTHAVALAAGNAGWSRYLCDLGRSDGFAGDVLPACESAVAVLPDNPESHLDLGLTRAALDDPAGASDAVGQAVALAAKESAFLNNELCWDGTLNGVEEDILPTCERAVRLEPNNANYLDSRGVALALVGERDRAIEDFARAVEFADQSGWTEAMVEQRRNWIEVLEEGGNPFPKGVLEALSRGEGQWGSSYDTTLLPSGIPAPPGGFVAELGTPSAQASAEVQATP